MWRLISQDNYTISLFQLDQKFLSGVTTLPARFNIIWPLYLYNILIRVAPLCMIPFANTSKLTTHERFLQEKELCKLWQTCLSITKRIMGHVTQQCSVYQSYMSGGKLCGQMSDSHRWRVLVTYLPKSNFSGQVGNVAVCENRFVLILTLENTAVF